VSAPRQLDGAAIVIDGVQTSSLIADELRNPVRVLVGNVFGERKPTAVSATCQVPAGTHTIRFVKRGWEPIERTIEVKDDMTTIMQICAVDLRPVKATDK
jgi:hypothetical protein